MSSRYTFGVVVLAFWLRSHCVHSTQPVDNARGRLHSAAALQSVIGTHPREEALSQAAAVQWLVSHAHPGLRSEALLESSVSANVELALRARKEVAPAAAVPWDIYMREVMPPVHVDEPVNDWRPAFYEKLSPEVAGLRTLRDVADRVVPLVFSGALGTKVTFRGNSTPHVMAPVTETLHHGFASCTGLSILVADALRSVGVPARLAGTARWNTADGGNHNWVEAWLGDGWHFLDAVPTARAQWDAAWFVPGNVQRASAGTEHGIYSPVWAADDADATYTLSWRDPPVHVPARDRTRFYQQLHS